MRYNERKTEVVRVMVVQQSFADMGYSNRKRKTKRDEFLGIMEEVIPWDEWCAIVEPYYPSGERSRPPREVETMLRMSAVQLV